MFRLYNLCLKADAQVKVEANLKWKFDHGSGYGTVLSFNPV